MFKPWDWTLRRRRRQCRNIIRADIWDRASESMPRENTNTRRFHFRPKNTWSSSPAAGKNMGSTLKQVIESCTRRGYLLSRSHDRLNDLLVTCAAADIAVHKVLQLFLARMRIFVEQRF